MRKINKDYKSKRAFTLLEMVIVIGIIVILATVLIYNINDIINAADAADQGVADASNQLGQAIDDSERQLSQYHFCGAYL